MQIVRGLSFAGDRGMILPRLGRARFAALGVVGVATAHTLAYLVVAPEARHRAEVLRATGHAYWEAVVIAACMAAVVAAAGEVAEGLRRSRLGRADKPETLARAGVRLGVFQALVFGVMEVAERVSAHAPIDGMFTHRSFLIGVLFQFGVAAVLIQALRFLGRAVVAVATLFVRRPAPRPRRATRPVGRVFLASGDRALPCGSRAPPAFR